MDRVRLGIVGVGTWARAHSQYLLAGKVQRADLVAMADIDPAALARFPALRASRRRRA